MRRFVTLLVALISIGYSETQDITTAAQCTTCLSTLTTNFVCKDNTVDTSGYCCASTDTTRQCKRNVCSNNVNTTSMKLFACPYETKVCGGISSQLPIILNETITKASSSSTFKKSNVCYYAIKPSDYGSASNISYLNIMINSYKNTYIYLNNGTSPNNAANQTTVDQYTGSNFTVGANQIYYMVVVAYDDSPSINFTYRYYQFTPKANETIITPTPNITVTCPGAYYYLYGIKTCNITETTVQVIQIIDPKPQYGVLTIMGLVIVGVISYYFVSVCDEKKKKQVLKKQKIINTTLTDYELQPIEKQDMNYDEAVLYFNTARNSQRFNTSIMHDEKGRVIPAGDKLESSIQKLMDETKKPKRILVGEYMLDEVDFRDNINVNAQDGYQTGGDQTRRAPEHDDSPRLPKIIGRKDTLTLSRQIEIPDRVTRKLKLDRETWNDSPFVGNSLRNSGNPSPQIRLVLASNNQSQDGRKFTQMLDSIINTGSESNKLHRDSSRYNASIQSPGLSEEFGNHAQRQKFLKDQISKYEKKKSGFNNDPASKKKIDSTTGKGFKSNLNLENSIQSQENSHRDQSSPNHLKNAKQKQPELKKR
ncbi:UNKNOWN [Stylonychia lemnae]|uniref:Uncharacterized protein n=1 Tax=Stylonychia lemnae TaxID=5949 RepID=A0A077ZYX9_STYLE|nr:UNKNOWN [Stylonychia lemnae]|eukprot:CDW73743.1 UNKNOWN [Stylonychia lemnae]